LLWKRSDQLIFMQSSFLCKSFSSRWKKNGRKSVLFVEMVHHPTTKGEILMKKRVLSALMMKSNWSLRFHNKVWLTTLLAVVCTFVFNLLDLFGIETTVAQEQVMQLGAALLSLLSTLGVVIDPTTPGVSDSQTVIERK